MGNQNFTVSERLEGAETGERIGAKGAKYSVMKGEDKIWALTQAF